MSQAKMTLIGFYKYLDTLGSDLFFNLALPTGIDKDAVVNNILMRGGEFEVLYSNPVFMRDSIITWSKKWHWTFDKWYKAININYDPLHNYDRHEEWTEESSGSNNRDITNDLTQTNDLTNDESGVDTQEHLVSAFDSSEYSPDNKDQQTHHMAYTNTGTVKNTGTVSDDSETNNRITHDAHLYGNIGVTTSQQMLQSEIDIAMFNLYDKIADVFLQEYVLPIY